jgi:hypothetical protein
LQKDRVEKFLQKKTNKNPKKRKKTRVFLSRFWAFLDEGSSKTLSKNIGKKLTLVLFWPLTHSPTHHGGHRHFFWRPLPRKNKKNSRLVGGWVWDLAHVRGRSVDFFGRPLVAMRDAAGGRSTK